MPDDLTSLDSEVEKRIIHYFDLKKKGKLPNIFFRGDEMHDKSHFIKKSLVPTRFERILRGGVI
jgi:hypothetical protein